MACYRFTCAFSDLSCFLVMPPALRLLWSRLTSWLNPFSFTMGRTTEWSWVLTDIYPGLQTVPLGWTTAAHATRARKRRLRKIQHIHRVLSSSSSANMVRESRPKHRVACIVFMAGREISKGESPWTTAALIVPWQPPIPTGSAKLTSDTSQSPLPNLNKTLTPRFGTRWDVHLRPNVLELIQRRSTNGWCGRIHCPGFHSWWQHQENFLGKCMTALRFIRLQSLNHGGLIAHRCTKRSSDNSAGTVSNRLISVPGRDSKVFAT